MGNCREHMRAWHSEFWGHIVFLYKWEESYVLLLTALQLSAIRKTIHAFYTETLAASHIMLMRGKIHISLFGRLCNANTILHLIFFHLLQKEDQQKNPLWIEELFFLKNCTFFLWQYGVKMLQIEVLGLSLDMQAINADSFLKSIHLRSLLPLAHW